MPCAGRASVHASPKTSGKQCLGFPSSGYCPAPHHTPQLRSRGVWNQYGTEMEGHSILNPGNCVGEGRSLLDRGEPNRAFTCSNSLKTVEIWKEGSRERLPSFRAPTGRVTFQVTIGRHPLHLLRMRLIACLLMCMLPLLGGGAEIPEPILPAGVGVNIHFVTGHEKDLDMIVGAGFKFVRMDFQWGSIETHKGGYDWSGYEELLTNLEKRGPARYFHSRLLASALRGDGDQPESPYRGSSQDYGVAPASGEHRGVRETSSSSSSSGAKIAPRQAKHRGLGHACAGLERRRIP